MLERKRNLICGFILSIVAVFALGSCGGGAGDDVSSVIAEGILAAPGTGATEWGLGFEYSLVEVQRGDMVRNLDLNVNAEFMITTSNPDIQTLQFRQGGGIYSGPYVSVGDRVREGDILGWQCFEENYDESLEVMRLRAEFQLEQFEANYAWERENHLSTIADARAALANAPPEQRRIMSLHLERHELQFERFLNHSRQSRQRYQERLAELSVRRENIYAPFDGIVTTVSNIAPGTTAVAWQAMFVVAYEPSFQFFITAPVNFLRYGNAYTLQGPGFDINVVANADPLASGTRTNHQRFTLNLVDWDVFIQTLDDNDMGLIDLAGRQFRLPLTEVVVHDTLFVHRRAIRMADLTEYLMIYDDGRHMNRYFTRGIEIHDYVEILAGVEEGQLVVVTS